MRTVPGFSKYKADDDGNIIGQSGNVLRQQDMGRGYVYVAATDDFGKSKTVMVHRMVAAAFIENPESKPQVNHIDGNKKNNKPSNLEWATRSENIKHSYSIGLSTQKLQRNNFSKVTPESMKEIARMYVNGEAIERIGKSIGVSGSCVALAISGGWLSVLSEDEAGAVLAERAHRSLISFAFKKRVIAAKKMLRSGAIRERVAKEFGISKTHTHRIAAGLGLGTYVAVSRTK